MTRESSTRRPWRLGAPLASLAVAAALLTASACVSASSSGEMSPSREMSPAAPSPDPRVGLAAGWFDAAEASWNMSLVSTTKPSEKFFNPSTPGDARLVNSDLAFLGNYVFQGNYSGYQVWDISNPRKPTLRTAFVCPGSQSDVSVYRNLMFVSAEAVTGRIDCGMQGVADTVSKERARGIRIFDITDVANPKSVAVVQTCRGSHTNTLVVDPKDPENVYVYVSGSSQVRSSSELSGCSGAMPDQDPNSALFRIEVIRVPLAHPEQAAIVSSPRIFNDLAPVGRHGENPIDSATIASRPAPAARPGAGMGPTQCHDITVYPAVGLAGGACGGYGLLLDISDAAHPKRIDAVADSNMGAWHSVTFNNDGSKVLFTDEWGGGSQPRCRKSDKMEWGGDAVFTLENRKMKFHSYYKMPAPQTQSENCVAHNGSMIPVPGRDIMVQGWYQGGLSVFEFTDPAHPREIAFFDRGPMDASKLILAGSWSAYWYNGYIVSSEIARGLDIFELKASALLSQNEIDAAKSMHLDYFNAQGQPKFVWPASFAVARSYLDQLVRGKGLSADRTSAIARDLASAESMTGQGRSGALTKLATQLDGDASASADGARVRSMAAAVRDLAGVQR
ncbi:MAG: hypothetical protein ABJD07_05730 [Gemmatimonadaceae bacterium]